MKREHILMILGALVILAPWSGLPMSWLEWILPLIGIAVIGITATLRSRALPPGPTFQPPSAPPMPPPSPPQVEEPRPRPSHIAFS